MPLKLAIYLAERYANRRHAKTVFQPAPSGETRDGYENRSIPLIACLAALILAACTPPAPPEATAPTLLFNGTGSSPNDVKAVETILQDHQLKYATVNSAQLNGMSAAQLMAHRLLIIPGGNYIRMGRSLTTNSAANIRNAVQGGLNYLGICAGGLLAGDGSFNNLNLTSGVHFDFYAVVNQGVHKAVVPITAVGTPPLEHYWEDGPQFTGWGAVVATYPDGTPAVVEETVGKGWVILCGTHPEAPATWRRGMNFTTPETAAHAYAGLLIDAALNGTSLPH